MNIKMSIPPTPDDLRAWFKANTGDELKVIVARPIDGGWAVKKSWVAATDANGNDHAFVVEQDAAAQADGKIVCVWACEVVWSGERPPILKGT